jgi:hypothetical protein
MRRLQMGVADWYAIKKKSVQLLRGHCFRKFLYQAEKRMEGMELWISVMFIMTSFYERTAFGFL